MFDPDGGWFPVHLKMKGFSVIILNLNLRHVGMSRAL